MVEIPKTQCIRRLSLTQRMNGCSCVWQPLDVAPTKTEVLFIVSAGLGQSSRPLCGAASSFQTHTSQLLVPESERRDGYSYLKTTFDVISGASDALVWGKLFLSLRVLFSKMFFWFFSAPLLHLLFLLLQSIQALLLLISL